MVSFYDGRVQAQWGAPPFNAPVILTPGPGVDLVNRGDPAVPNNNVDFGPTRVTITWLDFNGTFPETTGSQFVGGILTDIGDSLPDFASVRVNRDLTSSNLDGAGLSWSDEQVRLDLGGLRITDGATIVIDVTFEAAPANRPTQGADRLNFTDAGRGVTVNALGGADTVTGSRFADTIGGADGNDRIAGGDGGDALNGGGGNDLLAGGIGSDTLSGLNFQDTLNGGAGSDLLGGGRGADTYIFAGAFGRDTVVEEFRGFANTTVDLSDVGAIASWSDLRANHLRASGDDVLISDGNGNTIRLVDVALADVTADDFLF